MLASLEAALAAELARDKAEEALLLSTAACEANELAPTASAFAKDASSEACVVKEAPSDAALEAVPES
jgi:hypothetical protein